MTEESRMTETETATQTVNKFIEKEEESSDDGKERSWWTAVGLFTLSVLLFSRCSAACTGKGRERRAGAGE